MHFYLCPLVQRPVGQWDSGQIGSDFGPVGHRTELKVETVQYLILLDIKSMGLFNEYGLEELKWPEHTKISLKEFQFKHTALEIKVLLHK
jgi:hypothetical protein